MMELARCPNGRQDEAYAHEFDGYGGPSPEAPNVEPVIYCRRCGEVRPMATTPIERAVPASTKEE